MTTDTTTSRHDAPETIDHQQAGTSLVRRSSLTATNDATKRTVITFNDAGTITTDLPLADGGTNTGPSPVLALVGTLCGCEAGTFGRTANELGLAYRHLTFEGEFRMDGRTRTGLANAATHIRTIRLDTHVHTDAALDDLARVAAETERRCPITNLIRDAGVQLQTRWIRVTSTEPTVDHADAYGGHAV